MSTALGLAGPGYDFVADPVVALVAGPLGWPQRLNLTLVGVFALPEGGPLHPWWGLLNWAAVTLWLACVAVLAARLLRLARAGT